MALQYFHVILCLDFQLHAATTFADAGESCSVLLSVDSEKDNGGNLPSYGR